MFGSLSPEEVAALGTQKFKVTADGRRFGSCATRGFRLGCLEALKPELQYSPGKASFRFWTNNLLKRRGCARFPILEGKFFLFLFVFRGRGKQARFQ